MSRSWSRWHTKIFPQPSSSPFLPLSCSMVCIFQAVNCPHLRRQYMFNECFSCICIGFSEFNKPAMCRISHCHFFSIMLFVLPFRTEHSTYFILSKVCHFVGRLKHKYMFNSATAICILVTNIFIGCVSINIRTIKYTPVRRNFVLKFIFLYWDTYCCIHVLYWTEECSRTTDEYVCSIVCFVLELLFVFCTGLYIL